MNDMEKVVQAMVAPAKGILAADESILTIGKRFAKVNVENTEENRRAYRELLFTAPEMGRYISGAIMFDETIRQRASDGHTFVTVLEKQGVLPGIKVDEGAEPMTDYPDEMVTKGMEGLSERLRQYINFGARFAKWRAVIKIGHGIPTEKCIQINAERLARYARLCQESGLVPIVEPEVLMDGNHTIESCFMATKDVLTAVFAELKKAGVLLEGVILKPNMVISGNECNEQASAKEVAAMTVRCLKEAVPAEVPGIAFLSGGQSEKRACGNLNEISKLAAEEGCPWQLTFSYGRALQSPALEAWGGKPGKVKDGQEAFLKQAGLASLARQGRLGD